MIAGTYVHGIFERPEARKAVLEALARARGFSLRSALSSTPDPYEQLADILSDSLDLHRLPALARAMPRERPEFRGRSTR
jgi:cobyric acid synthase